LSEKPELLPRRLVRQSPGDLAITGLSQDRRNWIIAYLHDNTPREYFHYDRDAGRYGGCSRQRPHSKAGHL